ncbi:MAG: serine/threonine-protein kinase [Candidatus Acidiferrales bacterium]|jgi:serine/threonine protein kinase
MRDMTLGDRIEIKLYAYADGSGNGEPRSMTLGEARSFIREGSDTDLVDALVRLASSGFVSLDKWVPNENRFVSFGEFPNVRSFFYGPPFGAFRAAVTASGRHDFEHRTPPERRPSSQKADPSPPIKENERWKIIRTLTEGGQGQLFLVSDTTNRIQSTCVLKRLKNITSEERRSRFTREVEATQRIRHPNVLRVHDSNLETNRPYYVGENCELGSLESRGASMFRRDIAATTAVLVPIIDAILAAHAAGVIHRDLKPANILFRADGTPVVADFGICHIEDGQHVTVSDEGVGSRNYIAPEMESGQHNLGGASDRTDVYSLGKVIYWMLSGGRVFSREEHRSYSLSASLQDQEMEYVHDLLDQMIVKEPTKRLRMVEVSEAIKMTRSLVEGNFAPLKPSIGIRCRFCGLGQYARYASESGRSIPSVGLHPTTPGGDVRVLRCSHCGHIEIFQVTGIDEPVWWDR